MGEVLGKIGKLSGPLLFPLGFPTLFQFHSLAMADGAGWHGRRRCLPHTWRGPWRVSWRQLPGNVSLQDLITSPGSIMWAPVNECGPGARARINDCGPARVHHCKPAVQLVRAATATLAWPKPIYSTSLLPRPSIWCESQRGWRRHLAPKHDGQLLPCLQHRRV
jgi:hypothetical protein